MGNTNVPDVRRWCLWGEGRRYDEGRRQERTVGWRLEEVHNAVLEKLGARLGDPFDTRLDSEERV